MRVANRLAKELKGIKKTNANLWKFSLRVSREANEIVSFGENRWVMHFRDGSSLILSEGFVGVDFQVNIETIN